MKAVILIGGPQKGTRFRPLSLEIPKPLFPVGGQPMIEHHIEACIRVPEMREIILIGYFSNCEPLRRFLQLAKKKYKVPIRYLQEYESLGTGGGLYHFRDHILSGSASDCFFVMNCDVCCDFPLKEMLKFRQEKAFNATITILGTEANRKQALNYGCIVEDTDTHEVLHYVEKPETFVSNVINTGVYIFSPKVFDCMREVFEANYALSLEETCKRDSIRLEQDVLMKLSGGRTGQVFVYKTNRFWSQIKTASSTIYANRLYLGKFQRDCPDLLESSSEPNILGDVRIHETAEVDPTAKLGPNVYIGAGVKVGAGARVKESIVLDGAVLDEHCCILHSIIGWNSKVGQWARVEGSPCDPNPNDPLAQIASDSVFNGDGRLNPAITILGKDVTVSNEMIILNSIVLPHKELSYSYKNQIIL